jgi:hypothetical protein
MANENDKKEKSQISWSVYDMKLMATLPVTNEQILFDPKDLHETWKDFITMYGIKQYCSSNIAGESFPAKARLEEVMKEFPELTRDQAIEVVKAEKPEWLKKNAPKLRTALWNEFQALKVAKVKKESAGRESKAAAINAAVMAENARLIALATKNAKSLNIPLDIAMKLMGIVPIVAEVVETKIDVLNDESLEGNE